MKTFRRFLLIFIVAILTLDCAGAWTIFGSDTANQIADSEISDKGEVRVYLKSLNDPQAILITIAGEYCVNGVSTFRFERGTNIVVTAINGSAYMTVGGLTVNMGSDFSLTRAKSDDTENGLYIFESERDALFEGDLHISCNENKLTPILYINIEDYLKGVVAYEMSDSFPIEALKAQAVAARTYAMRRRSTRIAEEYDVTDTTSDQVYKGLIADYVNVIAAVEETRGVVGTYKGDYAGCWYTASNGGQISTPNQIWGGDGDYSYIEMKDDPYDVENPRSMINTYAVDKAYDESDALWGIVSEKFDKGSHEDARIDSVIAITPANPKFEGSLMCNSLDCTLAVSYRDKGWVETEFEGSLIEGWARGYSYYNDVWHVRGITDWARGEDVPVSLSVYDEIKDKLNLGLNSSDYETVAVTETELTFEISMRRFGHGVGMSQRGAQNMAGEHAKTYVEILNFYYPGMTLERINWDTKELPQIESLSNVTAMEALNIPPTQEALPEIQSGESYATVALESSKSRLNVRAQPTTDSAIVCRLNDGYRLIVKDIQDNWAHVYTNNIDGYVRADYLTIE